MSSLNYPNQLSYQQYQTVNSHYSQQYSNQTQFNMIKLSSNNNLTNNNNPQQQPEPLSSSDEYLKSNPFYNIPSSSFDIFLTKTFNSTTLQNLKITIASLPILSDKSNTSIGPFSYLAQLIENTFQFDCNLKQEMLYQYKRLYSTIYKWRKTKGDGNCFYRAVIFSFIENIILSSNLQMLQNIIFNIHQCYTDPIIHPYSYINSTTKIDSSILLNTMILIYVALKKNQVEVAYEIFIKTINNFPHMDLGLVLYFRYIIYKFIKDNEKKLYTKDFSVLLGNLLPSQYETSQGEFLFEEFYEKYLMKMNQDTEKIVIYITPYVLGTKLDILLFDCDYENNHNEFAFVGKNNLESDYSILLISKKEHYELGYCKNYYSKYKEMFRKYRSDVYKNIILVEIDNESEERNDIDLFNFNTKGFNGDLLALEENKNGNNSKHNQTYMPMINNQQQQIQNKYNQSNYHHQRSTSNPNINHQLSHSSTNGKCQKCSIDSTLTLINPFFTLCYKCFYSELQLQITVNYLKCLTSFKSFFKTNKNVTDYNTMFNSMFNSFKITIASKKNCIIDQTIQIFNHNNPNKIYLNTFFTQIKATKCLNCFNDVNESTINRINLPCLCVLCSKKCANDYFSNVNKVEYRRQKDYCCHCGTIYESYQLIALALLLYQNQLNQMKDDVLMLHKGQLKGKCMKCQRMCLDEKEKAVAQCYNVRNEMINMMGVNVFNHLLCKTCLGSIRQLKVFFCAYCRCEHGIVKEIIGNCSEEGFI